MTMIVNINPSKDQFEETKKVLHYAALAKDINPIRINLSFNKLYKPKTGKKKKFNPKERMSPFR